MLTLKEFIIEALINQNVIKNKEEFNKNWGKVTYEDFIYELDKVINQDEFKTTVYKNNKFTTYTIILGCKENNILTHSKSILGITLDILKDNDNKVNIYLKLIWTNTNKSKDYVLEFDNKSNQSINYNNTWDYYYNCTPDVANHIINGFTQLYNNKEIFKTVQTARFTDSQWNIFVNIFNNLFNSKLQNINTQLPWNK